MASGRLLLSLSAWVIEPQPQEVLPMFIRHRRLLDQITLLHGPHDLLGRFFLIADTAARDRGVKLRLRADFDGLVELHRRHRESWTAKSPIFDPAPSNLRI